MSQQNNHTISNGVNKTLISIGIAVLVLVGIIVVARPSSNTPTASVSANLGSSLTIEEGSSFDFGTISMAAGKVQHEFKIKNTSSAPVTISKMYTSCMCTTATLVKGTEQFGPFGMPGHTAIPTINQTIEPNEEVSVEAIFDPAAHGPAGVGAIARSIVLEGKESRLLEIGFSATVTP